MVSRLNCGEILKMANDMERRKKERMNGFFLGEFCGQTTDGEKVGVNMLITGFPERQRELRILGLRERNSKEMN